MTPINPEVAVAILTIGQFKPVFFTPGQDVATRWERQVPEEGSAVIAHIKNDSLELSITPAISAYQQHAMKRIAGAIYFEIAAKYAEKVSGFIQQQANVTGCRIEANDYQVSSLNLAQYPDMSLSFERICRGFRELFLHEHDEAV